MTRPRRTASDATYDKHGKLLSLTLARQNVPCVLAADAVEPCALSDLAITILAGRELSTLYDGVHYVGLAGSDSTALTNGKWWDHTGRTDVVEMGGKVLDLELARPAIRLVVLIDGQAFACTYVVDQHDTSKARSWHEPRNYRDYLRSPQRALWRTAMELKMDYYLKLDMYDLVLVSEVEAAGHRIMQTLWAFKIKWDSKGDFLKLNPRWCVVGTGMDRDVYESFSDVLCWTTFLVLCAILANYDVIDVHFDVANAFQDTKTDELGELPDLFYHLAPGFEQHDANGGKLCCRAKTAHQGRIDSARLFGTAFGRTLLT